MSTAEQVPPAGEPARSSDAAGAGGPEGRRGRGIPGELVLSVLLAVLGLYLLIDARSIAVPGAANTVGPRFFPYLVGVATTAVGLLLAVRVLRGERGEAEGGEDVDPDAPTSWRAVAVIAVAFLAHALLINVIGWPLAVTGMFGVVAWTLGGRRSGGRFGWGGLIRPLLVGGLASVIIWLLFVKGLGVPLPGGILLELATQWI